MGSTLSPSVVVENTTEEPEKGQDNPTIIFSGKHEDLPYDEDLPFDEDLPYDEHEDVPYYGDLSNSHDFPIGDLEDATPSSSHGRSACWNPDTVFALINAHAINN
jgi:hypothetical protein